MGTSKFTRLGVLAASAVAALALLSGCGQPAAPSTNATDQAAAKAANHSVYSPQNDVELKNYNARTRLADDPSSIIWCSVYPTNQNIKPYTVPIVGKLTSGGKRPIPTEQSQIAYQNSTTYYPELPGPDGMYGTSGDYRYGFDPAGNYYDFYNVETMCTSTPSLIQKQTTDIAITNGGGNLTDLDNRAQDAMKACRAANPDPSAPCPAAAAILGVG